MDNDQSTPMYAEQPQANVPALLKFFFPASARALSAYEATWRHACDLQHELDRAFGRIASSTGMGRANADDIIKAAKQASTRAASQREAAILRDLQMIDPDLDSIDAVRQRLMAVEQPRQPREAIDRVDDSVIIPIDGIVPPQPVEEPEPLIAEDFASEVAVEAVAEQPDDNSAALAALRAELEAEIERLRAEHQAEIEGLKQEHSAEKETMIAEYGAFVNNLERELDKAITDKDAAESALQAAKAEADARAAEQVKAAEARAAEQIAALESRINEHLEAVEAKDGALERYYGAYADIFAAFMDRVTAVRDAYTGNDPDSPVARAIADKIMTNDSYGLDDFCYDLRASMEASAAEPAELRQKVREAFLECLQTSSANWLNVLARFHAYGRVPFVRKALEDAGLDMALLDRAFISLEDILAYAGIDLCMPALFADEYDSEQHSSQPIRNIDTYIPDIASHAGPDTIVDLYLVGYDAGDSRRNPVVSKLA